MFHVGRLIGEERRPTLVPLAKRWTTRIPFTYHSKEMAEALYEASEANNRNDPVDGTTYKHRMEKWPEACKDAKEKGLPLPPKTTTG